MQTMPQDWMGLMLVVFMLGMKHGMDPDHLATIDGLVRFNAQRSPRLSRWSGFLFSLGHGVVVTIVAAIVALGANHWSAPPWLEEAGAWISIAFLLALGVANLRCVWRTAPDQPVQPAGIRTRWLRSLSHTSHPVVIAAVGAAFALSFDTVSQAALFSLTASKLAGWLFAIGLGGVFMAGMMLTDGVNGLWVARLLRATDRRALVASRVMGLSIGFLSLAIAALGLAKHLAPAVSAVVDEAGLLPAAGLLAILLGSYALALRLSPRTPLA